MDLEKYKTLFLSEAREYLKSLNDDILSLEKEPGRKDLIDSVFRSLHSLKGMSASMGYSGIEKLSHTLEDDADDVRKRRKRLDKDEIEHFLKGVDSLAALVEAVEAPPAQGVYALDISVDPGADAPGARAFLAAQALTKTGTVISTSPSLDDLRAGKFEGSLRIRLKTTYGREEIAGVLSHLSDVVLEDIREETGAPASVPSPRVNEMETLRVRASLLDECVDSVGELLVAQSRLESLVKDRPDTEIEEAMEALRRHIASFHSRILGLRLTPLNAMASKYPRAIRDLARQRGKEVEFSIDGGDVEMDRRILEELDTPILHVLRNAVDHGIEGPEERAAGGKERMGRVCLKARRERDHIIIEISDDGRGMDAGALVSRALALGKLGPDQAQALSREDALLLACLPGLTTVDRVTKSSGRGVGMDIIKGKAESLGGHVAIASDPGKGTCVTITLPVGVAIFPVLLVSVHPHTFGLPISKVFTVLDEREADVHTYGGVTSVLYEGALIPVGDVSGLLGVRRVHRPGSNGGSHIVLCHVRGKRKALRVDRVVSHMTAYIRPVKAPLNRIPGLLGTTLLGDGRIVFILDPHGILP